MTQIVNDVDTMLSGSNAPPGETGSLLETALSGVEPPPMPVSAELFSTYLVSPAYYSQVPELLLVKLVTTKGEPFYLLDPQKNTLPLVCGTTEIFLTPYNAETACSDECDGMPALHLVPECIAEQLFKKALKGVCNSRWFAGIVFVSNVGMQFYYKDVEPSVGETPIITNVYRVALNREGQIETRDAKGAVTCDYPVPYFLVNECVFAEGIHTESIVESLVKANASLVDSLCRIEYTTLHHAEEYPDDLDQLLGGFMGSHSHLVRGLLEEQLQNHIPCEDAFVRRQRKSEIDTLVRLMMREVELIAELSKTLEELRYVKSTVEQQPASGNRSHTTTLIPTREGGGVSTTDDLIAKEEIDQILERPMTECSDEGGIANENVLGSPSTGSECSR